MRLIVLLGIVLGFSPIWAQDRFTERVPVVVQSGYYRIALSQEMIGVAASNHFKDLRLKNQDGREIGFFVVDMAGTLVSNSFVSLGTVKNMADSQNSFTVVQNQEEIDALYVQIKSLDVSGKQVRIRGSHDGKQWYLVKSKTTVKDAGLHFKKNDLVFEVLFPKGNYRFYEVMLSNDQEQPAEIWSVRIKREKKVSEPNWVLLPFGPVVQYDSLDGQTYLQFPSLKQSYDVRKIEFQVNNAQKYLRKVRFSHEVFSLSSKSQVVFFNNGVVFGVKDLLSIDNRNDEPLEIEAINIYGAAVFLCAYIAEGDQITVEYDRRVVAFPDYDIAHFKRDIPAELTVLNTADFIRIQQEALLSGAQRWFESPVLMWGIIIVVGLFLLWICFRISKDLRHREF